MKYNTLQEKINALVDQTESIAQLKKMVEEYGAQFDELRYKHSREFYYNREKMVMLENELNRSKEQRESYATQFNLLENRLNPQYEECKQRLNAHYYTLQSAFNDYVKGKTKDNVQDQLKNACKELNERIIDLEQKMLKMFFEGCV